MDNIFIDSLIEFQEEPLDVWADVLKNLDNFYNLVDYIYDEEGWKSFTFS